jgi:4-amino-4-deoxy-L-arabinose transferase-like glycosyltransferase
MHDRMSTPARAAALIAVLLVAGALRWTTPDRVADLRPWPDALEYEEAARSLYAGRGYLLWIGSDAYPPRYPPGTSLLIAATMPLLGTAAGVGIFAVVASGLAAVAGAYVAGRIAGGFACGVVAALLLAVSPLHVQWSRAVMSDVPASAAVVWLAVGVLQLRRRRAAPPAYVLLGVVCGLAGSIRYVVWGVVPAACAALVLCGADTWRDRLRAVAALLAGAAIGVLPLLWLNAHTFGSPLRDGYGYWVHDSLMSAGRAFARPDGGTGANVSFYGAQILGLGTLYPWPAAVLLALGTVLGGARGGGARALVVLAWVVTGFVLLVHAGFMWQWDRFLLPMLPLACAVMALPVAHSTPLPVRVASGALVALAVALVAAYPRRFAPPDPPAGDVDTLRRIARIAEPNAAVLARTNPFAFERELRASGADRVWVPLQTDAHTLEILRLQLVPIGRAEPAATWIRDSIRQPFSPDGAVEVVRRLCAEGRPVYVSDQLANKVALLAPLELALARRFGLTQVLAAEPFAVYRLRCPAGRAPAGPVGAEEGASGSGRDAATKP